MIVVSIPNASQSVTDSSFQPATHSLYVAISLQYLSRNNDNNVIIQSDFDGRGLDETFSISQMELFFSNLFFAHPQHFVVCGIGFELVGRNVFSCTQKACQFLSGARQTLSIKKLCCRVTRAIIRRHFPTNYGIKEQLKTLCVCVEWNL